VSSKPAKGGDGEDHGGDAPAGQKSQPRLRWLVLLFVTLAFGAVRPVIAQTSALPDNGAAAPQTSSAAVTPPVVGPPDYKLGTGDRVRIIVFGEDSLTGEFDVPGGSGLISFPLIGDVRASGLTVSDLRDEIEAKLKDGYLKDPHVSIEVLNYRPFYILGEVTKPGEYPYTSGLTVMNAVATANGFTYRADTRHVFIKRANDPKQIEYPLNGNISVGPGDTILVKERFF
jgi:polysaccharide export outer membrane protein